MNVCVLGDKTGVIVRLPPIFDGGYSVRPANTPKEDEKGNDGHGSKIVVIPFDGAALDRDLQQHK